MARRSARATSAASARAAGASTCRARLAVLPRRELDDIVCRAAARAGARMHAPARFEAPLLDGRRVVGARLQRAATPRARSRARWVVLATGAVPQALIAAGMCERRTPSGVALRGYVQQRRRWRPHHRARGGVAQAR